MRLLAITNWYPPHHFGGYELLCHDVMERMARRGHEVGVLCSDQLLPGVDRPAQPHVHRELRLYVEDEHLRVPGLRGRLAVERNNQGALVAALDEHRPDVVAAWHFGALSLGLLTTVAKRGIPIVYGICDDWLTYGVALDAWGRIWNRNPIRRVAGRIAGAALGVPTIVPDLGQTGAFCFISELTRRTAVEGSPWRYPRSAVVPAGIDRATFGEAPPDRPEAREWRWRLVYLGRFDQRKGVETLLRALPLLPAESTIELFGRGGLGERERLAELAGALGIGERVRFGQLDRSALAATYGAADCLVFPSEWPEPFGLVPIEAMACRTPVVATGVGGSGEFLVDGENALLFEPGNPSSLAAAITRLALEPELRRKLRLGGDATAKRLDVDRMADGYEEWFRCASQGFREPPAGLTPGASTARA